MGRDRDLSSEVMAIEAQVITPAYFSLALVNAYYY